jgi:hypothetical protein
MALFEFDVLFMPPMIQPDQIETVLDLWHRGIGAAEIGRRFGQSRDWARRIIRKSARDGDPRAKPHRSGNLIGAERPGYEPKTRRHYTELQRQKRLANLCR